MQYAWRQRRYHHLLRCVRRYRALYAASHRRWVRNARKIGVARTRTRTRVFRARESRTTRRGASFGRAACGPLILRSLGHSLQRRLYVVQEGYAHERVVPVERAHHLSVFLRARGTRR